MTTPAWLRFPFWQDRPAPRAPIPDDDTDPLLAYLAVSERILSPNADNQSNSFVHIESSKLVPWLLLSCLISGVALAISIMSIVLLQERFASLEERYRLAEREARVATERVSDMKVELTRRGIPVTDH